MCYSIFLKHLKTLKEYCKNVDVYFEMCNKYGYDSRFRPNAEYISNEYPEDYQKYEQSKRAINLSEKKIYAALVQAEEWLSHWKYRRWNPFFYFKKLTLKIVSLPVDAYEYFYRKDDSKNLPTKTNQYCAVLFSRVVLVFLHSKFPNSHLQE